MKIVVIGGSGLIGKKLIPILRERGHEAAAASPSTGVNAVTGEGLARALAGADGRTRPHDPPRDSAPNGREKVEPLGSSADSDDPPPNNPHIPRVSPRADRATHPMGPPWQTRFSLFAWVGTRARLA